MPLRDFALGRYNELMDPEPLKAGFAELVATFFFVFIGQGCSIAFIVVSGSTTLTPVGLLIAAICHGFAIYAAIANSYHVSGGHVNPAVTVGLLVGGYITVLKAIMYIIMQLIGAVLASLLLKYVTNGVVSCACLITYSLLLEFRARTVTLLPRHQALMDFHLHSRPLSVHAIAPCYNPYLLDDCAE